MACSCTYGCRGQHYISSTLFTSSRHSAFDATVFLSLRRFASWRQTAAIAMIVYALVGLAGAPVFAQFSAGFAPFAGKSGGFIISYIPAAFAAGWFLERNIQPSKIRFLIASLIGTAIMYLIGTTYMYLALKLWIHTPVSYGTAWGFMIWFMVKDTALAVILSFIAPAIYRSIHKATGFNRNHISSM